MPDKTLVWSVDGKDVGVSVARDEDVRDYLDGGTRVQFQEREGRWFGFAGPDTAKVELVFADGTSTSAAAVTDPWNLGVRLFAGTHQRTEDIYLEGFQVVGYDESGTEIWRDPHPAQKPLAVTSAPS